MYIGLPLLPTVTLLGRTSARFTRRASCWGLAILLVCACDKGDPVASSPKPSPSRVDPSWVTGDAASALREDCLLQLTYPSHDALREISAARARELAQVYARTLLPMMKPTIENDRGRPVDVRSLALCGRTLYAASPYASIPDGLSGPAQRTVGAWWLVSLCNPVGEVEAVLGVAAHNTQLTIVDGRISFGSRARGNEFHVAGVPIGQDGFPESPESAISASFSHAGVRISGAPELVRVLAPGRFERPQFARWRIRLEREAAIQLRDGRATRSDEVFVGAQSMSTRANTARQLFVHTDTTSVDEWELSLDGERHPLETPRVQLPRRDRSGINAIQVIAP